MTYLSFSPDSKQIFFGTKKKKKKTNKQGVLGTSVVLALSVRHSCKTKVQLVPNFLKNYMNCVFGKNNFANLFYYSIYFCYYS